MSLLDKAFLWLGVVVAGSGAAILLLFVWYWIVEYALRLFKLKKLMLEFYFDKLKRRRGRVITPKRSEPHAR